MAPKKQQVKMSIGDFMSDQSLGSWADEMDSMPLPAPSGFGSRPGAGSWSANRAAAGAGPAAGAAPSADGGFSGSSRLAGFAVREELPLPTKPPYTAHLGNLSFEVTEGDVQDFLAACEVTSIRIVEDKLDRRPKGFGYVEFATVDGLKKALTLSESQFQGRNIRISVADPPKNAEPTRTFDDWSRKGPLPDLPGQGSMRGAPQRGGSFQRGPAGFDAAASDAGSDRGARRGGFFEGDGKVRDFGNWERKGPLSPTEGAPRGAAAAGSMREGRPREEAAFRERQPAWGEGTGRTADDGSRPPRRDLSDRPAPVERQPTAADMDSQWRTRMKPDAPSPADTPDTSTPTSPSAPAAPAGRPRLNLTKRTVSEAPAAPDAGAAETKASIFGAARPIDTAAREREIEEKRQLAIRTKKEQQDKERDERRASAAAAAAKDAAPKDAASKEPKADRPARAPKQNTKEDDDAAKEEPAAGLQYEILRRDPDTAQDADADAEATNANGNIVDDKNVKPKESTREVTKSQNSWRKPAGEEAADAGGAAAGGAAPPPPPTTTTTTAEAVEDDGWSTVSKKEKNFNSKRGGGNAGGRAMAS